MMHGFHHGVFGHPFGPGPRTFDPRFRRFDRFEDRFERRFDRGFLDPRFRRFDGFEDRFERRFDRFDLRSVPGFFPGFFFPF
jgi:hypothetical protein